MKLTVEQRQHILDLLARGEELPRDYQHLLFPPERREYELVYADKEREADIIANTMPVPFQQISSFGDANADWRNMLIFGDNLQAMRTLLDWKKAGKIVNADGTSGVRLIYIDPPFATRQEFRGNQDQKAYQDKIAGARFLEFLRRRFVLMRELLSEDGSIFIHMDQRKIHYAKVLLDEVFTEANFRNEMVLPGRAAKNLQQQFETISRLNVRHDSLLWYSKGSGTRFALLWVEKHKLGNPEGHWHHFWSNADRGTMRYELFGIKPTSGQWVWKQERALRAVGNYNRFLEECGERTLAEYWRDTGSALEFIRPNPQDGKPEYWRSPAETRVADTMWSGIPVYGNLMGYPTEKSEALLSQVLELSSKPGDIVLDGFVGSGTTCAVAEKLGRRWIGIDAGKFAIYTTQKRLLNLQAEIGNKGKPLAPKPFSVNNAGLYDFSSLKELDWDQWRFFAMDLFECRREPHIIDMYARLEEADMDDTRPAEDTFRYTKQYPRVLLNQVVSKSIELVGMPKVTNRARQKFLQSLGTLSRAATETVRYVTNPDNLLPLSTHDRQASSISAAELRRDKTYFYTEQTPLGLKEEQVEFFNEATEQGEGFRVFRVPNYLDFKTPLNAVIADSDPEKRFIRALIEPANLSCYDAWIKSTPVGFYEIDFSWKKGSRTKRGKFSPDFFIKSGDLMLVVEIKEDEEMKEPSAENRAKRKAANEHFALLNDRLEQEKNSTRYLFHFLTPADFGTFFDYLCKGNIRAFKSGLDVELVEGNA